MIFASIDTSPRVQRWSNGVTSQRMRFQEPCVLPFFAGVDIHSRERPVAIEPRFMVMAVESNPDDEDIPCRHLHLYRGLRRPMGDAPASRAVY